VDIVQCLKMRHGRFIQVHSRTFRPQFFHFSQLFLSSCSKCLKAAQKSVFEGRNMSKPADFALASNSKDVSKLYDYSTTSIFPERDRYHYPPRAAEILRYVCLRLGFGNEYRSRLLFHYTSPKRMKECRPCSRNIGPNRRRNR
jgi:hypothetical protein